jgi:hypothetical protein
MAPAVATSEPWDPSRTVLRTLRRLGYLEVGSNDAVATGYDPLLDNEPELACTMAASIT